MYMFEVIGVTKSVLCEPTRASHLIVAEDLNSALHIARVVVGLTNITQVKEVGFCWVQK